MRTSTGRWLDSLLTVAATSAAFAQQPGGMARGARWLSARGLAFDTASSMVVFDAAGRHAALPRETLWYAVELARSGDAEVRSRIAAIARAVLPLQVADSASPWFGLWPVQAGDDVRDPSHRDRNQAEFMAAALLDLAGTRAAAGGALGDQIDTAIGRSIAFLEHRDLGERFTNMVALNTSVLVRAAIRFRSRRLRGLADGRLAQLRGIVIGRRDLSEYNSPTYTIVALDALAAMQTADLSRDERESVDAVYERLWLMVARHYHSPTGQWAGPHSRAYPVLLTPVDSEALAAGIRGDTGAAAPCPPSLRPLFGPLLQQREVVDTFVPAPVTPGTVDRDYLGGVLAVIGTTELEPGFALGSISAGDFWVQRRPLLAYWPTGREPGYFRLRFLKDGSDSGIMQFFSVQDRGDVLAGLVPVLGAGDRHPDIPSPGGTMSASDLRLRFDIGDAGAAIDLPVAADGSVRVESHGIVIWVSVVAAGFGGSTWSVADRSGVRALELVLYHGDRRDFALADLRGATTVLAIRMGLQGALPPAARLDRVGAVLTAQSGGLRLRLPADGASTVQELHLAMRQLAQ